MESEPSNSSKMETFRLFDENPQSGFGLNFLEFPEKPFTPPPPCIEVLPSQVSCNVKYTVETVNLDGITLIKGRVNTKEVFAFSNLDLVPGKYEGGLKLWEGSLDLVKTLRSEMQDGKLSLIGKRVLENTTSCLSYANYWSKSNFVEPSNARGTVNVILLKAFSQLGCGHGLPGIFACLMGSSVVHFQDFNVEVLQSLTIPNVNANIKKKSKSGGIEAETRFFAGDWSEVHNVLPYVHGDDCGINSDQEVVNRDGYDIVLMAETVYSLYALPTLYKLIKKCLNSPHGVVYMAAKKHYFGVGGGSRRFLSFLEKDGVLTSTLVAEVADGSSNLREVWKFQFK